MTRILPRLLLLLVFSRARANTFLALNTIIKVPASYVQECNSLPDRRGAFELNLSYISSILDLRGGGSRDYSYDSRYDDYPENSSNGRQQPSYDDRYYNEDDRFGNDDRYEYDRNGIRSRRSSSSPSKQNLNVPDVGGLLRKGNKQIGMVLLGVGAIFTLLGISLFFNKVLLRLGNLLFIAGVPMFIGPSRTMGYFLNPQKVRATTCLAAGIFLVMVGWPILGMALEVLGILNLFGNMFPVLMVILKQMPFVGALLKGSNSGSSSSRSRKGRRDNYRDDYRYEDEYDRYSNEDRYNDRY